MKLITVDHRKAWILFKGDKIVYATDEEEFRTLFFLESAARRAALKLVEKTGEEIEVTAVEIRKRYRRKSVDKPRNVLDSGVQCP
jgi:hypothetical protein